MRTTALAAFFLLLGGCGAAHSGPTLRPGQPVGFQAPLLSPPEQVLAQLPWIYRDLGLIVAEVREEERRIRSGEIRPQNAGPTASSSYYRCSRPPFVSSGSITHESAVVTTTVGDEQGQTRVQSYLTAALLVVQPNGSMQRYGCVSTGRLEQQIHTLLRRRIS